MHKGIEMVLEPAGTFCLEQRFKALNSNIDNYVWSIFDCGRDKKPRTAGLGDDDEWEDEKSEEGD